MPIIKHNAQSSTCTDKSWKADEPVSSLSLFQHSPQDSLQASHANVPSVLSHPHRASGASATYAQSWAVLNLPCQSGSSSQDALPPVGAGVGTGVGAGVSTTSHWLHAALQATEAKVPSVLSYLQRDAGDSPMYAQSSHFPSPKHCSR